WYLLQRCKQLLFLLFLYGRTAGVFRHTGAGCRIKLPRFHECENPAVSLLAAYPVNGRVAGNSRKPSPRIGQRRQLIPLQQEPNADILGDFLRHVTIAHMGKRNRVNYPVMRFDKGAKRFPLSRHLYWCVTRPFAVSFTHSRTATSF